MKLLTIAAAIIAGLFSCENDTLSDIEQAFDYANEAVNEENCSIARGSTNIDLNEDDAAARDTYLSACELAGH